jgi:hypothetical protein
MPLNVFATAGCTKIGTLLEIIPAFIISNPFIREVHSNVLPESFEKTGGLVL